MLDLLARFSLYCLLSSLLVLGAEHVLNQESKHGPSDDSHLIQGTWEAVSVECDGKVNKEAVGNMFTFSGTKLTMKNKKLGSSIEAECVINAGKTPKELTWTGEFMGNHFVVRAIYELRGDRLKYCALQQLSLAEKERPRPTEFKTVPGDDRTLAVLKRISARSK
jgi:uncharacterized protein (TIGR03067 family)